MGTDNIWKTRFVLPVCPQSDSKRPENFRLKRSWDASALQVSAPVTNYPVSPLDSKQNPLQSRSFTPRRIQLSCEATSSTCFALVLKPKSP